MQVTIITSVLNGAKTLPRCLQSVAAQTCPCEHIVVDGGSNDGSQAIVRGFANAQLVEAPGTGISEAFNIGIQRAAGEWIGILNADDWLEPDAVERSLQTLAQNPDAGFTYGAVLIHYRHYDILARPVGSDDVVRSCVVRMPFFHISSLVKRSLYAEYGLYDPSYRIAMDFDLYARMITRGARGACVPGIIGHVQGGGVSGNLWARSSEYFRVSAKYIGPTRAFYHAARFAGRTLAFGGLRTLPGGRRFLKMRRSPHFEFVE